MDSPDSGGRELGKLATENVLEHFGTRGMRWGVRKDTGGGGGGGSHKTGGNSAHGTTSVVVTNHTPKVGSVTLDATRQQAYIISAKKATSAQKSNISKAIKRELSSYEQAWEIRTQNEAQARKQYEETGTADVFKVRGLKHDDILEHVGIRGMRWGVRRDNPSGGGGGRDSVTAKIKPGKGIVKIKGGGGRLPSEDALNAASYKQRAAKSTVSSLDNKELQSLVTRLNLEQQYNKLTVEVKTKSAGRKAIDAILLNEGKSLLIKGKAGPIAGLVSGGLKATGKHRGTQTVGKLAVKSIMAAGTGKHRLA